MLNINLLPPELRRRRRTSAIVIFEPTQTFLVLLIALISLACVGSYILINVRLTAKQKELNTIKVEMEKLEREVAYVRGLESDAMKLEERIKIIDKLMFSRMIWSRKLNELSNLLPENIWFTSVSITKQGGSAVNKYVMMITGKVINNKGEKAVNLVGVFINNMKNNASFFDCFTDVEFLGSTTGKEGDQEILNFSLRLPFK